MASARRESRHNQEATEGHDEWNGMLCLPLRFSSCCSFLCCSSARDSACIHTFEARQNGTHLAER